MLRDKLKKMLLVLSDLYIWILPFVDESLEENMKKELKKPQQSEGSNRSVKSMITVIKSVENDYRRFE